MAALFRLFWCLRQAITRLPKTQDFTKSMAVATGSNRLTLGKVLLLQD